MEGYNLILEHIDKFDKLMFTYAVSRYPQMIAPYTKKEWDLIENSFGNLCAFAPTAVEAMLKVLLTVERLEREFE